MNYDGFPGLARALFEESSDAQFLFDPQSGQILDANARAQLLSGFSLRDLLDSPVSELVRVDGEENPEFLADPPRKLHLPYGDKGCLLRSFQALHWIPVDLTLTRLSIKPKPLVLLTAREARDAEAPATVTPSGSHLRHLVAEIAECLWSIEITANGVGRFRYLSPVVESITGRGGDYFEKEVRRWRDLVYPDDQPLWDRSWERRRAGESTQDEYRLLRPDGSVRWIRDSARARAGAQGGIVWLFGLITDITSRKQAEVPVQRRAALLECAEDAIIGQSLDGFIVDWNRGAEHLYGYAKEEIRAKPIQRLTMPERATELADAVDRVRQGERVAPYETAHIRKDGKRVDVSVRVSPISGAAGVLEGFSIVARDLVGKRPPAKVPAAGG